MPPDLRDWLPESHLAWFVLAAVAAEINTGSSDFGHLGPMVEAAQRELEAAGITEQPGAVVADAGYWHQQQMEHIASQGIPVLVPADADKRKGTRPGWDGGPYAFMRAVLETELGKTLYRRRQETVEPVFANTKFNRGFDRFQRRGRAACHSEWRLINATQNLLKLNTASKPPERRHPPLSASTPRQPDTPRPGRPGEPAAITQQPPRKAALRSWAPRGIRSGSKLIERRDIAQTPQPSDALSSAP